LVITMALRQIFPKVGTDIIQSHCLIGHPLQSTQSSVFFDRGKQQSRIVMSDVIEFPTRTRADKFLDKMVSSMAESLGRPISNEAINDLKSIADEIAEKRREFEEAQQGNE